MLAGFLNHTMTWRGMSIYLGRITVHLNVIPTILSKCFSQRATPLAFGAGRSSVVQRTLAHPRIKIGGPLSSEFGTRICGLHDPLIEPKGPSCHQFQTELRLNATPRRVSALCA